MCTVIIGSDGHEALSLAASHMPDLILLDVMMPGLDGYQVCTRLKQDSTTAAIPVIFVSAMDEEEDETRGLELGAIDYITKPLKAPIVRARVRNHLELKRYRDLLENLSIKDALTGIANRRRLDEVMNLEWRRALRSPAPLSFILMDIDCFKAYNDNYGHTAGDECLRQVARALASATRRFTDLVARYGGEEFACVLPTTDAAGAAILGNRLRAVVEALNIPHAYSPVTDRVTISVGVATVVPTPATSQSQLTETADRRLYEAKRTGRNRVVAE
jgi:diguanylate cyclase (GGDEF)-like protein